MKNREKADLLRQLASNVRRLRENQGLSQVALAHKVKMSRSRLNQLELVNQDPRVSTILRIAKALKVSVAELLE